MSDDKPREPKSYRQSLFAVTVTLVIAGAIVAPVIFAIAYVSGANDVLLYFIAVATFAILLIAFCGGWAVSRRFSGPIVELRDQTDRFTAGDYNMTFHVDDAPREVVDMADSLNAITKATRIAVAELKTEEQRQRQFVSDVSHEIRTPLTGIRGNAETLLEGDVPLEDQQHFLGTIISECDRLTRLANDLLELQRIEADTSKPALTRVDLRQLVNGVVDMLDVLFESRGVEVSVNGEAPDVLGDKDKLTQVVVNLLENASRFANGHVHVELAGIKGQSVITVTDDGPGFGDIDPSRLFDRFYRGDKSRASATGGTGLGLAIVKSIVTAHDGTVEAFNIPNGGACFAVGIPSIAPR